MTDQVDLPALKHRHDPKVLSMWIGICFVVGFGIGAACGNAAFGGAVGIPIGLAIGWIRGRRNE